MLEVILGFPQALNEIGLWIGFLTLLGGFLMAIHKMSFVQTFITKNITDPLGNWFKRVVSEAQAPYHKKSEDFQRYVRYHLGPNGTTPAVHERLRELEKDSVIGEMRQRRVLDNIDVMIAESDADGQTKFVNLALCEALECDPEDWYGEGWKNFIAPEQISAEVERWESVLDEGKSNPFHDLTLVSKKSKNRITVRARAYPLKASGELIGYVGEMYRD